MRGILAGVSIARRVVTSGATEVADRLAAPDLQLAFIFADWRLDPVEIAATQTRLSAPVVGCSTLGVVGGEGTIAGLGLYGDWLRVGIGVAAELSASPLTRSRDAVRDAATQIGQTVESLDPARHVIVTLSDGRSPAVESWCIGSAAAAPQVQVVGGCASTAVSQDASAHVWTRGTALPDAGLAIVLECARPFHAMHSAHMLPTDGRVVVTAASGRVVEELDGVPAIARLLELVERAGLPTDNLLDYSFARYIDGTPYVRSMTLFEDTRIHFASAVEVGHVLRLMRPGDLVGTTKRDLATAAEHVGGSIGALLAFSCVGRHWEADSHGLAGKLAEVYAAYPAVGFQSYGEQTGMLLVNHTLTGLVIG